MLLRVPAFASSLRFRLSFATALAVLLSMATFIALSYAVSRRGALDALSYSLTNVTQVHAKLTAAWIDTQRRIVEAAAQLGDDADRPQSLVQALSSGHFFTTYVAYPDKRFIAAPKVSVPADFDPTSRDWYRQAVQARGGIVTEPYVDAGTGSLVLTFAHARMHNGAVRDVTGADVYLDSVARHIAAARPTENGFALLISASGTILAHADSALWMKPLTALDPSLDLQRIQEASGQSRWMEMSVKGEAHYLHAERVEGTQWTLLLAAPQRDVLADLNQRIRVQALALILIVAAVVVLSRRLLGTMLRRLQSVSDAMHLVGSGDADLSHRLPSEGSDEISVIASSFNRFAGQLSGTIQGVRSASDSIATASRQISAGSQDLSRRTEDAASRLQQTASAVTVVANTVRQGAQYADEARELATQSAEVARHGQQVVQQVVTTMGDIHAASQRVGDIIGVIDSIAFQTNILALNAAVEAARAGEQGRGFAVVAGEVRSLAQRSSEAAREITALIGSSMEGVERGSRLVNDAGALMTDVVASVEQVTAIISQVSTASREQLRGIERVHDAALELDRMTQQNAALSEQSAAAAESLDEQAARLAQLVASFRLQREIAGTDPGGTTLAAGSYATGSM